MKIFVSYSHKDKKQCVDFRTAMAPLKRTLDLEHWYDGLIPAGGSFDEHIARELDDADIIVLLVSPQFFKSDYCHDIELERALERRKNDGCVVIPVIVDHTVGWTDSPLGKFKALPEDGKPVREYKPQSKGWASVAGGIRALVMAGKTAPTPTPPPGRERGFAVPSPAPGEGGRVAAGWGPVARQHFHLPVPHNPLFTGRADDLTWIAETLAKGEPVALLHGMGGVGKTLTAAEFARSKATNYTTVWWVAAETATEADAGYGALAQALTLPGYDPRDTAKTRKAVVDWMDRETGWLVVLDNAESPAALKDWLPNAPKSHLLITSRNPDWKTRAEVHPVDVWPVEVAAAFLMKRSSDNDQTAAEALARTLGGLPLACEQAGAYAAETGCGISSYAELLETEAAKLLATLPAAPTYPRSLAGTVTLAVKATEAESPLAAAILRALAWLAADGIPRWLLDYWPAKKIEVNAALAVLLRRALVRRGEDGTFAVHRLTQLIVRDNDPAPMDSATAAVRVVSTGCEGHPQHDVHLWPRYAALLPHGAALFALLPDPPPEQEEAESICNTLGLYIRAARGDYSGAKTWSERVLKLTEARAGPDRSETAIALSNLADLSGEMGDFAEAKRLYQRALAIDETALGPDHPNVAIRLAGLGNVYFDLGELGNAHRCLERALKIEEAAFGADHPNVAADLNNLAFVLEKQSDKTGARSHLERALDINLNHPERGPDHPQTALRHHNLGSLLYRMDEYAEAETHLARALAIREKQLAPGHPDIQIARDGLAIVRAALGKG